MGILLSIFDYMADATRKSIQCEVADRGEYAWFGSYPVRKFLALFPRDIADAISIASSTTPTGSISSATACGAHSSAKH
jgi:hypothetical protein